MATGKNDRKKRWLKILSTIVVLALILFVELYLNENSTDSDIGGTTTNNGGETSVGTEIPVVEAEGELILTMIDVGQADSFLLVQGDEVALIDCGTRFKGDDVVNYLKEQGITKIDYLFGTHPHDDHMGGMLEVITNIDVGKVIIPEVQKGKITSNWYKSLMDELSDPKYVVEYPEVGNVYYLGDATLEVIGPISEHDNLNNYSTVMKVSFGEMDIIMTGDAEVPVEKEILETGKDLDAEILKMGHHGSDTSSSIAFLDAVSPEYVLISAGVGNKYNHPIKSTMENLEEREILVYRTDECGTVILTITTNSVEFSCTPGDYLSGPELEERSQK